MSPNWDTFWRYSGDLLMVFFPFPLWNGRYQQNRRVQTQNYGLVSDADLSSKIFYKYMLKLFRYFQPSCQAGASRKRRVTWINIANLRIIQIMLSVEPDTAFCRWKYIIPSAMTSLLFGLQVQAEVHTTAILPKVLHWYRMPCSLVAIYQIFRDTSC